MCGNRTTLIKTRAVQISGELQILSHNKYEYLVFLITNLKFVALF